MEKVYREQQAQNPITIPFTVFRGQGLPHEYFNKMKQSTGGLMAFNNFLSTSRSREISIDFARSSNPDNIAALFVMKIDPKVCEQSSIPFVGVKDEGYYKDQEKEVLFATHSIFRIERMDQIKDAETNPIWEVHLTLTGDNDKEMGELTGSLREEIGSYTGWSRLGWIFIKIGEFGKAAELYQVLLDKASSSDKDCGLYLNQLGHVYDNMGEYSKALSSYERSLEITKVALPSNHPDLATSYNNIGMVYYNMGEYSKAVSFYERSLEIDKVALPPNHPNLAISYSNIAAVYYNLKEYSKALELFGKALEIRLKKLPPGHSDIADTIEWIEDVKQKM